MIDQRATVLIVDDEDTVCDFVSDGLVFKGYLCDIALDASDALTKLKEQDYDIVLLDINLPNMSGLDLLKIVNNYYQMTAVIMISGVKDLDTVIGAMKLGASDYIIKPFTIGVLSSSISVVLKKELHPHSSAYHADLNLKDNDFCQKIEEKSFAEICAIADGIDAQVDYFDFHSKIVTCKTVELSRWLGLPEKVINLWEKTRDKLLSKRNERLEHTLNKLEGNPAAHSLLSSNYSIRKFSEDSVELN